MPGDEVGKVSLGIELEGGNDLNKQITMAAGVIGEQLNKSLQSTFGGFSLKGFAANISQTLKSTTEMAMKGLVDGMEQSVEAVEGRLLKTIDTASQAMHKSIDDNKAAAENAIDSISTKLGKLRAPSFFSKLLPKASDIQPAAAEEAATDSTDHKHTATKAAPSQIDTKAARSELDRLGAVLDNVNAKAAIQERRLAELRSAYANTFSDDKKNRLQEKIVNTEAALLRLSTTSDKTAKKIWELEDSLNNAGGAVNNADKPLKNLGQKLIQTNKPLKQTVGHLHNSAQAATRAGNAYQHASHGAYGLGAELKRSIRYMLMNVLVVSVLYKAITSFGSYLNASLKTNAQYAASLNAIKTNLAVAFQPIYAAILPALNALMSFLARVTAYIAAFISALFGKTYQQSYAAAKGVETARKALDGYGKSAKKAGKDAKGALASFDQLNTLDFTKDAGSDNGAGQDDEFAMKMPDMDINGIQSQMDKLAAGIKGSFQSTWDAVKKGWDWTVATFGPSFQAAWNQIRPVLSGWAAEFGKVFSNIISLGAPLANWLKTNVVPLWQQEIGVIGDIISGLLDVLLQAFTSFWSAAFPILQKIVTDGLPVFTDLLSGAMTLLQQLFDVVKSIFDDIWSGAVDPAMQLVSHIIQDTLDIIFGFWTDWGKKIIDGLSTALAGIKKLWQALWDSFLQPFISNMLDMLTQLWDKHLKALVAQVADFVGRLITDAEDILNKFILPIVTWLVEKLGPTFANVFSFIGDVLGTVLGVVADVTKGLIKMLGGIIDFLTGVFTGNWEKAWGGIRDIIVGVTDAMVGIFKGAINLIIDAINFMIRELNQIKINVPDWVGKIPGVPDNIGSIGFNIPTIPKLAKGGLAYGPTLAMVGDNRGAATDPEVISPLSKLETLLGAGQQPMIELLSMILDAIRGDKETIINFNGTELARYVISAHNDIARRNGGSPLTGI